MNTISKDVANFYNNNAYPNFGEKGIYTYTKMKRKLFSELGLEKKFFKNKSILEAGCGTGESTLIYHYFNPKELWGIDIASKSISIAKELSAKLNIEAEFIAMDLSDVGSLNKKFDFIMCEVLHQTSDPLVNLSKLTKILHDDGFIVVSVAHQYGNFFDVFKRKILELFVNRDNAIVLRLAKILFFNRLFLWTKARGVRKSEHLNLDGVIADIYQHPFRRNISNSELLQWLHANGLEFVSSYPRINFKGKKPNFISMLIGNMKLLLANEYHISVLAKKREK